MLFAVVIGGLVAGGILVGSRLTSDSKQPATASTEAPMTSTTAAAPTSSTPTPSVANPVAPSSTSSTPTGLAASFNELASTLGGSSGIAAIPVGGGAVEAFGQWTSGPAWSTSKIPVVAAALREQGAVSSSMDAAITQSDNAAAEQVWASLGDPSTAKSKVEAVLADAGDSTPVQSERIRAGFTAFGQTNWSLSNQAKFLSNAACDERFSDVLDLMGRISQDQRWGLGRIPEAEFKGGWGPSESGSYLVRQVGVIATPKGRVAIAIAAEPSSGSFDEGTQELTTIADWIADHADQLPAGSC